MVLADFNKNYDNLTDRIELTNLPEVRKYMVQSERF